MPRTRSRRRSWCWRSGRVRSARATLWPGGFAAWRFGSRSGRREADRRRRREAAAMARAATRDERLDPDTVRILYEEIDRLPEALRLPVVLVHLEGRTYEQTARLLRVPATTIRGRLSRAREGLAARLTRRGVVGGAALVAFLSAAPARAAHPIRLAEATTRAAMAGAGTARATGLADAYLRALAATKAVATAGGLLLLSGVVWFAAAMGGPGAAPPRGAGNLAAHTPLPPAPDAAVAASPPPVESRAGETIEVAGRVLDPEGRPVAGAVVHTPGDRPGLYVPPKTATDADGRFRIRVDRAVRDDVVKHTKTIKQPLVAIAPGFGLASGELDLKEPADVTIRLTKAGPPIEGRIMDLEGRPVAGRWSRSRASPPLPEATSGRGPNASFRGRREQFLIVSNACRSRGSRGPLRAATAAFGWTAWGPGCSRPWSSRARRSPPIAFSPRITAGRSSASSARDSGGPRRRSSTPRGSPSPPRRRRSSRAGSATGTRASRSRA